MSQRIPWVKSAKCLNVTLKILWNLFQSDRAMDNHTPEQRKKNMQAIKSKDTEIELILRKELWSRGYRYRKNYKKLIGKPDVVLTKHKIVIFCDSEFWHGKNYHESTGRIGTNADYWKQKIQRNIERDREVNEQLEKEGWTVLRFWEKEIKKEFDRCISVIQETIENGQVKKDDDE